MSNKKQLNARRSADRRKRRLQEKLERRKELEEKRATQLTLEIKENIIKQVIGASPPTFSRSAWKGQVVVRKNTSHQNPDDVVLKTVGFNKAVWRQKVENGKDS